MPGRPKVMANKITELEAMMEKVWRLIEEYIPRQYEMQEGPLEEMEPVCQSWNRAVYAVTDASLRVGELATMLRAKAGISESERREARIVEIAQMRGQGESAQAASSCDQGPNGETEPMGPIHISN